MKFLLLIFSIPFFFVSCLFSDTSSNDSDTSEETEENAEENDEGEAEDETESAPEPVTPVNITSDVFISNFFSAGYDYRNVSLFSTYDFMTNQLGDPEESGELVDGTYYSYGPIAFNFPSEAEENSSELQIDGIIIFPEEFYKIDAVEHYGWPTFDEPGSFRMFYDGDSENGYYIMLNYDGDDRITSMVLHNKNLQDTDFYE